MTFVVDTELVRVLAQRMTAASDTAAANAIIVRRTLERIGLASTTPDQLDRLAEDYIFTSGVLRAAADGIDGANIDLVAALAALTGLDEETIALRLDILEAAGITGNDALAVLIEVGGELAPPESFRDLIPGLPPPGDDPELDAFIERLDDQALDEFLTTGQLPEDLGRADAERLGELTLGSDTFPVSTGEVDADGNPIFDDVPLNELNDDELAAIVGFGLAVGEGVREYQAINDTIFGPSDGAASNDGTPPPTGDPFAGANGSGDLLIGGAGDDVLAAVDDNDLTSPEFDQAIEDLERRLDEAETPQERQLIEDRINAEIDRREDVRRERADQVNNGEAFVAGPGPDIIGSLLASRAVGRLTERIGEQIPGSIGDTISAIGGSLADDPVRDLAQNSVDRATEDVNRLDAEIEALENLLDPGDPGDGGGDGGGDGPGEPETGGGGGPDDPPRPSPPRPDPPPEDPPLPSPPRPDPPPEDPPLPSPPRPTPPVDPSPPRPTPPVDPSPPRPDPVVPVVPVDPVVPVPVDPNTPVAGDPTDPGGGDTGVGGPLEPPPGFPNDPPPGTPPSDPTDPGGPPVGGPNEPPPGFPNDPPPGTPPSDPADPGDDDDDDDDGGGVGNPGNGGNGGGPPGTGPSDPSQPADPGDDDDDDDGGGVGNPGNGGNGGGPPGTGPSDPSQPADPGDDDDDDDDDDDGGSPGGGGGGGGLPDSF